MKTTLLFYVLIFFVSYSVSTSQDSFIIDKKVLKGVWKGKEINYFEQIISFVLKEPLPYDSTILKTLGKRFNAKVIEYDESDGYVTIEKPKGADIFKEIAQLEKDTTIKYISPLIQRMTYILSEREKEILRKRVDDSLQALKKKATKKASPKKNNEPK
ncbi:MAG: hypothetical protein AAB071_05155 [Bacteroidota bacterium]